MRKQKILDKLIWLPADNKYQFIDSSTLMQTINSSLEPLKTSIESTHKDFNMEEASKQLLDLLKFT